MNDPEQKINGRPITETQSEFRQNDCTTDDIISAYFEERCDSRLFSEKDIEAGRDSSIGVIDVDNVSFFDEEGNEMQHVRFSEQELEQQNRFSLHVPRKLEPEVVKSEGESELHRQRVLAHQALMRLEEILEEEKIKNALNVSEKKESMALSDKSSKLMNMKLPKSGKKDWFQPNISPKTPRCFNDELSSCDGEDENLPPEKVTYVNEVMKKRHSLYDKAVNSMLKENTDVPVNSDMKFETQTKEEQINRLEEDEKKFKLEKSGVLHNSQISQFSGIAGGDIQWQLETSNSERENKNLSIGQFFNLRSDRISSLVGSADINFEQTSGHQVQATTSSNSQPQLVPTSKDSSSPNESCHLDKPNVRRCLSTDDLNQVSLRVRYSNDSRSSSSTLFVQQMLAEMKPGISGEEINDMLLKSFSRRLEEARKKKIQEKLKASENRETPKTSKVQKGRDLVRFRKESDISETFRKTEVLSDQRTILCADEEGKELKAQPDSKSSKTSPCLISNKKHKLGVGKGFYSSTPKNQDVKSETDKFRKNCGKVLLSKGDWEPPRINSCNRIERGRSECSDDNDKTILVNSTVCSELNQRNGAEVPEAYTVEDTIVAGDLTVLSQRIEEMKEDSVCIVRSAESEEPVLFNVIQKLALFPKGSLDCSALTPLLRDQFPELLSNFPVPQEDSLAPPKTNTKVQDALLALPGSWVKLPSVWGQQERILASADVEKAIDIPISNISQNWLLVSVESVTLVHSKGKKLTAERKGDAWWIREFVCIHLKETVVPPGNSQSLKVSYRSTVGINFELVVGFGVRELMNGEIQTRSLQLFVNNFNPQKHINVLPNDVINFGVIANQCCDQTVVEVSYDGICELPLMVYIDEDEAALGNFILKSLICRGREKEVSENACYHLLCKGKKQILYFRIFFQPNVLRDDGKIQDFEASFVLKLGCETVSDGILKKIPLKGSVGFARLLTLPSHSPLVFKASEKGQSVTRSYPLKNAGQLAIVFSIAIVDENSQSVTGENLFDFPKSFYLPKDEESELNITFNANGSQNFIKRYIRMRIKPNSNVFYEIELIGIIATSDGKPASRTSGASRKWSNNTVSTKSTAISESIPMKLFTTSQALSWTAVALEKEVRQTFQIKSSSTHAVSVRISLERNLEAFKLVDNNGEKVKKLRKVLKPDTPCPLTIIFRPDFVGAHNNSLTFEISHLRFKKKILLSGIGGTPNVLMRNVKSDLNGCKLLRLSHSHASNQFENTIKFTNCGRIPAFVIINSAVNDFSLSHNLTVFPCSFVVVPGSSVDVEISQKLRTDDLQQLLSHREIYKIATLYVISGDEPSRLRIKKLIGSGSLQPSERLNLFTGHFHGERQTQLKYFKDPPGFEIEFLKRLIINEVAVVVERNGEVPEPSILEETANEFFSFLSEQTVISRGTLGKQQKAESCTESQKSTSKNDNEAHFSGESQKSSPHKRVTKWLETLECV